MGNTKKALETALKMVDELGCAKDASGRKLIVNAIKNIKVKFKKAETIEDCIVNVENRNYESLPGYLKNDADFIKLKELVKNFTPTSNEVYKSNFRFWVKDNFTKYGNIYIDKSGHAHKINKLESLYKTELLLTI